MNIYITDRSTKLNKKMIEVIDGRAGIPNQSSANLPECSSSSEKVSM